MIVLLAAAVGRAGVGDDLEQRHRPFDVVASRRAHLTQDVNRPAAELRDLDRDLRAAQSVGPQQAGQVIFDLARRLAADLKAPDQRERDGAVGVDHVLVGQASSSKTLIVSTSVAPTT